jgi:peptidoglycan/xylan/chitin deacetylase (PgdA/CDA1 family)
MKETLIEGARRAVRLGMRASILGRPHGLVPMYHRIATPSVDPWDIAVSPENFAQHLEVFGDWARCRTFGELAAALHGDAKERRSVAITFDDGYVDNLTTALPLLEKHDAPATVFILTSTIGAGKEFWWDALARVFLTTPRLPRVLELDVLGGARRWDLGDGADCTPEELRTFRRWRMRDGPRHPRARTLGEVWRTLFESPRDITESLLAQVIAWSGGDREGPADGHPVTEAELARLAGSRLVEIGGHTMRHPALDTLTPKEAEKEISGGRRILVERTGRDVTTFAYPFGRCGGRVPDIVRDAGFSAACTAAQFLAIGRTDPYRIPRLIMRDWDGETLARMLRQFAGA